MIAGDERGCVVAERLGTRGLRIRVGFFKSVSYYFFMEFGFQAFILLKVTLLE